jgi:hypothetical protein
MQREAQSCVVVSRRSQNHESPPEHWCKGTWKIKRGKRNNPNLIFYFHPVLFVCSFTSVISSSYPPSNYPSLSPRVSFFFRVTHDAFYRSIPVVSLLCKLHTVMHMLRIRRGACYYNCQKYEALLTRQRTNILNHKNKILGSVSVWQAYCASYRMIINERNHKNSRTVPSHVLQQIFEQQ